MIVLTATETDTFLCCAETEKEAVKILIRQCFNEAVRYKPKLSIYSTARYIHAMILKGKIEITEK